MINDNIRLYNYLQIDVHTIAVIKTKEDYTGISEGYENCFETINHFIRNPKITIKGVTYKLEFFLCCDYKVSTN